MFQFLSNLTSGDISLLFIMSYGLCYLVRSILSKINSLNRLLERFVTNVEILASNSSDISNNLSSLSDVSRRFTNVTENNNWTSNILEMIKMYIPLVMQMYKDKTSCPTPSFMSCPEPILPSRYNSSLFMRPDCNFASRLSGSTGATGPTGPSGATGAIGPISPISSISTSPCPCPCPCPSPSTNPEKINTSIDLSDESNEESLIASIEEKSNSKIDSVNVVNNVDNVGIIDAIL